MKWPWVSRLSLAEARADWFEEMYSLELAEKLRLEKRATEAESRYRDMAQAALQMRREGFQPPMPVLSDTEPDPLPVDVQAAIVAVGGEDGPLHDRLMVNAFQRMKQGWEVEAIVKEVYSGQDVDDLLG
jgi:hypothetical protein